MPTQVRIYQKLNHSLHLDISRFPPSSFLCPLAVIGFCLIYCIVFSHYVSYVLQSVFSSFSWTCHILRSTCQPCSMFASLGLSIFSLLVLIWMCGESDALLFCIPHILGDASQDIVRSRGHVVLALTVRFLHWAVSVFLFPYLYKCSLYSGLNSMSCGKNIKDLQIPWKVLHN